MAVVEKSQGRRDRDFTAYELLPGPEGRSGARRSCRRPGSSASVRGVNFFFFSSRRRHTRFDCDWSSDVCSSDLRNNHASAAAYRYDPTANRWERIADLPAPRHHMPLAVVGDTLYAVGGLTGESFVPENTLWLYREDANRWEPRAALPAPRGASGAAAVSGKLIVVGGWGQLTA